MGLTQVVPGVGMNPDFEAPAFSPDGNWLAFSVGKCYLEGCSPSCEKDCVAWHVYVVKTDGTGLHQVAAYGTGPTWSADGKWLTYQGFVGNAAFGHYTGVYVVRRDGKHRQRLAANGNDPVFAPRGDLIAYRCGGKTPPAGSGAGFVPRPSLCVVRRGGSGKRVIATGFIQTSSSPTFAGHQTPGRSRSHATTPTASHRPTTETWSSSRSTAANPQPSSGRNGFSSRSPGLHTAARSPTSRKRFPRTSTPTAPSTSPPPPPTTQRSSPTTPSQPTTSSGRTTRS